MIIIQLVLGLAIAVWLWACWDLADKLDFLTEPVPGHIGYGFALVILLLWVAILCVLIAGFCCTL